MSQRIVERKLVEEGEGDQRHEEREDIGQDRLGQRALKRTRLLMLPSAESTGEDDDVAQQERRPISARE